MSNREKIAKRAAREVGIGQIINLGIGIPGLIPQFIPPDREAVVHSENGVLGMGVKCERGTEDRNLINAGGTYVTVYKGASFFDSAMSFALVRSGRLDIAFLGALQVAQNGDLANWIIPGKYTPGIGGGMELAQKAKRVIAVISHTDRKGRPKILEACSLPLTAKASVDKIVTELAVLEVSPGGLVVQELGEGVKFEDVQSKTGAQLIKPDNEILRF